MNILSAKELYLIGGVFLGVFAMIVIYFLWNIAEKNWLNKEKQMIANVKKVLEDMEVEKRARIKK